MAAGAPNPYLPDKQGNLTIKNPAYQQWLQAQQQVAPPGSGPATSTLPPAPGPSTMTPPPATTMPVTPSVTVAPGTQLPGTYQPSPLPDIPDLPPVYTGPDPSTFDKQVQSLTAQLANAQYQADVAKSANLPTASSLSQTVAQLQEQLTQVKAQRLTAQQGVAANQNEKTQMSMLPGLERSLSSNLTGQAQYALSQLNPLIEQRLNQLGILESGALPAVEGRQAQELAQSVNSQIGNFLTGAEGMASLGGANSQFNSTIQALLGATQQSFANQNADAQTTLAQVLQNQSIQAQKDAEMPFWQQLLLSMGGGIGKSLGSGASQKLFGV